MVPDECNIASAAGSMVVPDVVLVPCVGHAAGNYRLGYGGGYFDRFLAAHPHVTTIGVSWSFAALGEADFTPQPHDIPLTVMVGPGARPGEGLVAFGANHGNEYEGPVAVKHLMRDIAAEDVLGRLILIPVLNPAAFRAGTRDAALDDGRNVLYSGYGF